MPQSHFLTIDEYKAKRTGHRDGDFFVQMIWIIWTSRCVMKKTVGYIIFFANDWYPIGLAICNSTTKLMLCKSSELPSAILEKRIIKYNVSYANDLSHAELQIATFLVKRTVIFDQIFQLNCSQFETSWSVTEDFTPEVVTYSRFPPVVVKKFPR